MRNFSSIAKKYLKVQKKRTVLTCIGIILSVALITGTGTILMSLWDKMYRDAVDSSGDFYAQYTDVSPESADIVKNHVHVEKASVTQDTGFAAFAQNEGDSFPKNKYYSVKALDEAAFSMLPVELLEGRLPQNPGEIVLEKRSLKFLKSPVAVGGKITLDTGDRISENGKMGDNGFAEDERFEKRETKEYTVVGFMEARNSYNANLFYAATGIDAGLKGNRTVYVKLDSAVGIRNNILQIAKDAGIDTDEGRKLEFNDTVLRFLAQSGSDNMNSALISMAFYIVIIIMLATIAVIYNAFNISVLERVSQFGLFRCIGATPAQIKGVVLKEAMILAAIGIPVGIVCGTFAMALVFEIFKGLSPDLPFADLRIVLSPAIIGASAVLGLATIYLSAAGPARRAAKVSPMEAVRNIGAYKKEKIKKKRSRLGKKLLGVQGFLAWRNLGRNKKRVRITVLSMVISIVLFIVVSSFIKFALMSGVADQNEYANFSIYSSEDNGVQLTSSEENAIRGVEGVKNIYKLRAGSVSVTVPTGTLNGAYKRLMKNGVEQKGDNTVFINSDIKTIGDESIGVLDKYKKAGVIDAGRMNAENGVVLVKTVSIFSKADGKAFIFDQADIKPGDTVEIGLPGMEGFLGKVKVEAVLTQNVLTAPYSEHCGFTLITTDGVYDRIRKDADAFIDAEAKRGNKDLVGYDFQTQSNVYVQLAEKANAAPVKEVLNGIVEKHGGWELTDYDEMAKNMQSTMLIVSILFYGFMAIIAFIGALNIINTISTNIILRTRELSVLKAVGMTKGGLSALVYLESIYYSVMAAVIGGALGVGLSWLLFQTGGIGKGIEWGVPWNDLFLALAGSAVICLLSGYMPLKRINKFAIMENISKEQ
jgi:putative ABC transport system permease protein